MTGGSNRANLFVLESVFNKNYSIEMQEKHRTQVVDLEAKVQEQAEEIEQANIKEEQA